MNMGFYPKLAWTNIIKNKRIYFPYMLTSTGIIMMFYIIAHLAYDKEVATFQSSGTLQVILFLGMFVIGIFSFIFLIYTNSFLMKRRKTELGLYNVLGMGKVHIARVLLWESLYISFFSLFVGIACGILFSKIGQLLLFKMLSVEASYSFIVYGRVVVITVILFTAIYGLIYLNSLRQIAVSSARELLSSNAAGEKEPKANFLIALIGIALLGGGYYIATILNNPMEAVGMFFIAVILVILGTYACFIAGSVALFKMLRKNKNYYYKLNHFISVSSMIYRMKRNGAGLASICILSTMVLVMLSSTACMYIGGDDSIKAANPKEIETLVYMRDTDRPTFHTVVEGVQDQSKEACRAAGVTEKNLASCRMCSFYAMKGDESLIPVYGDAYDKDLVLTYILPLEDYNFSNGVQKHLKPGEAMIYDGQNTMKGGQFAIGDQFQYQITEKLEDMIIKENRIFGVNELYIVVPTMEEVYEIYDYLNSLNVPGQDQMLINLSYWYGFDTGANEQIDESLSEQINRLLQGDITDPNAYAGLDAIFKEANVNPKYETLSMQTSATSRAKKEFYELYGGFFFLGIILSLTFLLATVLIMYYKQITEGYDDKDRFDILQKVGMTEREVKKSINSQVLTVFFAPLIMAGLHIAFAFHMISLMLSVFSISNTVLLIQVTVAAFLLFTAFYVVVYLGTSKIYYRLVSGGGGYKRKGPLAH